MLTIDSIPNVLLAMQDETMMQMVRDMLRSCSVENIGVHTSLRDAKATLRAHARKWDILLIDSGFPEAISEIRAIREEMGPHVKILYMVSMPTKKEEVVRAMRTGINGFIGSPFSQFTLEDKIDELMGKEAAPREISKTSILYQTF